MKWIKRGQGLLIACCLLYIFWWAQTFRPGTVVSWTGGIRGVLLLLTLASGLVGIVWSVKGARSMPPENPIMHTKYILMGGGIFYVLMILLTYVVQKRPVTTELLFIVAGTVLELYVLNTVQGNGYISQNHYFLLLGILLATLFLSMCCYKLYYSLSAKTAFYSAMLPQAMFAAFMAILLALLDFDEL
ncbi:MAG: hypothetical protein VZR02_02815 [Lachnospiraceae bacterium]|nr:hypothetical protein [Lachnospiraceae bacterium]